MMYQNAQRARKRTGCACAITGQTHGVQPKRKSVRALFTHAHSTKRTVYAHGCTDLCVSLEDSMTFDTETVLTEDETMRVIHSMLGDGRHASTEQIARALTWARETRVFGELLRCVLRGEVSLSVNESNDVVFTWNE